MSIRRTAVRRPNRLALYRLEERVTPFVNSVWQAVAPTDWNTPGAWVNNTVPGAGDTATFNNGATGECIVSTPRTVDSLVMTNAYTSKLTLNSALATTGSSTVTGSTITSASGAVVWTNSGTLNLGDTANFALGVNLENSGTLKHTSGFTTTLSTGRSLTNLAAGTVTWSDGTFAGGTLSNKGKIDFTDASLAFDGVAISNDGTLNHSGGSVSFANGASLTNNATGTATLNGGTFSSPTINNLGALTLNFGQFTFVTGTVTNSGTITHATTSNLFLQSGSTLTNSAGGSYNFATDGDLDWNSGTFPIITNKGTFRKTGGAGTSYVYATINDQGGTWEAQTGTLQMASNGGLHTGGTFIAAAGAVVDLAGGQNSTWEGTYTGVGAGVIGLLNGVMTIGPTGATWNFPAASPLHWRGGTVSGSKLTNAGTVALDGVVNLPFIGVAVTNNGTFNYISGNLLIQSGTTFTNSATGVFDFQGDDDVNYNSGTFPIFTNKGLIRKTSGISTSFVYATINNQGGTWEAQTGTLEMRNQGGANSGGTFIAADKAAVDLTGGNTATWEGTYTGSGLGLVGQFSGTMNIGALGATWNFPAATPLHWRGGIVNGASGGTLTNSGTVALDGAGNVNFVAATVINNATINHISGNLFNQSKTVFTNSATGVYDFQGDGDVDYNSGILSVFNNMGLVRKTGGTDISYVYSTINNSPTGTWQSQTGTLRLASSGGTHTGGTFIVAATAAIDLAGGQTATWEGTYTASGAGTVYYNSGGMVIGVNGATWNFPATTPLYWRGAIVTGAVGSTLTNAGVVVLDGVGNINFSGAKVVNDGTINHVSGNLFNQSGTVFTNTSKGVYDFQGDGDMDWNSGTLAIVINQGLIRKTVGLLGSYVYGDVRSQPGSTWEAQTGTLQLNSQGGTHTGSTFVAAAGAAIDLTTGNSATWEGTYTATGAGLVGIFNGTMKIGAAGATWDFPAATPLHWRAGIVNGASGGTLTNAGVVALDGVGNINFSGAKVVNDGTINHVSGNLFNQSGTNLTNSTTGVYDFQGDGDVDYNSGTFPIITNKGLIRKTAGTLTSYVYANIQNQPGGTWEAKTGTLQLASANGLNSGGHFIAAAGAVVDLTGGQTATWEGTYTASGAGTIQQSSSAIVVGKAGANFNFPAATPFHWRAGTITVAGGTLTNTGAITLDGGGNVQFLAANVVNNGTISHVNGNLFNQSGTVITNGPTGVFDFQSDGDVDWNSGTFPVITNKGVIRKSAGAGNSYMYSTFTNDSGVIDIQTGSLTFFGAGGGQINLALNKGTIQGSGTLTNAVTNGDGFTRPGGNSTGILTVGNYVQGTTGSFIMEVNGTTPGTQYDQLKVNGTVTLGGGLSVVNTSSLAIGNTLTLIDNDGSDPVIGTFAGLTTGSSVGGAGGGNFLTISYTGGTGNDVTLKVIPFFITIEGGAAQRSMVRTMTVTFAEPVSLAANAFSISGIAPGGGAISGITVNQALGGGKVATLTFSGAPVIAGSLPDGNFTMTLDGSKITVISTGQLLDADGDNNPGGTNGIALHRLFGDSDGDRDVDNSDFVNFRLAFGSGTSIFNYDGDTDTDNADFVQFRNRFGITLP